jgi:hypothetical protein
MNEARVAQQGMIDDQAIALKIPSWLYPLHASGGLP